MKVVVREPIPIYEVKCPECGSVIEYRACEVSMCHITCPVCGMAIWADTIFPKYEQCEVEEAE